MAGTKRSSNPDGSWLTLNIGAPLTEEKVDAALFTMRALRDADPTCAIDLIVVSPGNNDDPAELAGAHALMAATQVFNNVKLTTSWTRTDLVGKTRL